MRLRGTRLSIPNGLAIVGLALIGVGCTAGSGSSPTPSSAATVEDLTTIALTPAKTSAEPENLDRPPVAPSLPLPSGLPEPPPPPPTEYQDEPDGPEDFAAAYRAAFPGVEMDDQRVRAAGAALCTYLMRHANANGTVALEDALMEADLSEPGFARTDWLTAFEIANDHYCGSFSVDFDGVGR